MADRGDKKRHNRRKAAATPGPSSNKPPSSHKSKGSGKSRLSNKKPQYPPYWQRQVCEALYHQLDPNLVRGTLRVLDSREGTAFVTCDRGRLARDVILGSPLECNRALDGDQVFVELLPSLDEVELALHEPRPQHEKDSEGGTFWQDDDDQMALWAPKVHLRRKKAVQPCENDVRSERTPQARGRVVHVVPPQRFGSEINPTQQHAGAVSRKLVGALKRLQSGTTLLKSSNKSLVDFRLSDADARKYRDIPDSTIVTAKYIYGSWEAQFLWPPCRGLMPIGDSSNVEDETKALLIENDVDHGDFPTDVLKECQDIVSDGTFYDGHVSGWRPTASMCEGRRDFRQERIFTIDPTTAKDLDDALHIKTLPNGQVEIGVHIADVSFFVQPNSRTDCEAQRRCTTVYLVDRVIPMLPHTLCEIACSLNENVERLAFSCLWRMNRDGTLATDHEVWYGRSVIRSCARLDYATAQNIIDGIVAKGEKEVDEDLWPMNRRPLGPHTVDQVADDVRLMHRVAMNRRKLRFRHGAIALHAVKLTFELDSDGQSPLLCEPYPIRDSNRLVEEFMLLANYLVSQRLITHASTKALLRNHEPPLYEGLEKVARMARESIGFHIEVASSQLLQRSLNQLNRECRDEITMKCITEMLKLPMRSAKYVVAEGQPTDKWSHFALNIPYYTHFTSPIRRYADVLVHRILQTTIAGLGTVGEDFLMSTTELEALCERCNMKKEAARKAQDRSTTVFFALFVKKKPLRSQLGVVLSVGKTTFTVFLPEVGVSALLFLDEHKAWVELVSTEESSTGNRKLKLRRSAPYGDESWKILDITNFVKIRVSCLCREAVPINVRLELEGPW